MAQSLAKVLIHVVFSTKDRMPFLRDDYLRGELHLYQAGILRELNCPVIAVGGVDDHVHLLFVLSRTATTADTVKELKRASSIWLKRPETQSVRFLLATRIRSILHRLLAA